MQTVVRDSKVLSSLAKRKGEKGYRELQGEALRSMLFSLLKAQVISIFTRLGFETCIQFCIKMLLIIFHTSSV